MKFFVKDENGNLVEATQEQILDAKTELYNEDGELLNRKSPKEDNPIEELTNTVKDLALAVGSLDDIKEKQEELETAIAAYKDMQKKGFVMPDMSGVSEEDVEKMIAPYNLAAQGKRLMDKLYHPGHRIESEETRIEMAKYYCLFLKAAYMDDPLAKIKFTQEYGRVKTNTTDIGDSGNVFPVPDIVDAEILSFAREQSVVLQEARIWPMTSEKLSIPVEGAAVTTSWGNTTSEDTPNIAEAELEAKELSAYGVVKNATLADAQSDIVSWVTEVMAEAAGQSIDDASFNGTGDPTSGIFAKAGYSVVMASGSTSFSMITGDHLSELISKLDGVRKEGAKFYFNGSILHYIRGLKDDNSRPIFIEVIGNPVSGTIWGYPYREVVKCPSTSAANTAFVAFGNLKYLAVGRRNDATALMVDPFGLWTTNRTRLKIYQRWGITVPNLGLASTSAAFAKLVTAAS